MKQEDYIKLKDEVFALIDREKLSEAIQSDRSAIRVDGVQDLIRTAIIESSIGRYKGSPYFFNGRIYERMGYDEFSNLIYELMKECGLPKGDYARLRGVIDLCMKAIAGKELSPDKSIMVFKNGVLDTRTRKLSRFDKKFIQMTSVDYKYDENAIAHQWRGFLDSVLPDRKEQRILQEALGCLLINRDEAKLEHITFLYGTGANGKSVVFETVMGVFGKDNISNFPLNSLLFGSERKKNIATMDGLWANYSGESQEVDISRYEDAFKSLVSGEPTEARDIFCPNFMAYNIPLQFANINKMPVIKFMNNAVKRRLVIVDFRVEIPPERQNKQISRIFKEEYSGIFNWILGGRDKFVKNRFDFTDREYIDEKTDEYQATGNSVMKFMHYKKYYRLDKNVTDALPRWVYSKHLYSQYVKWCTDNDEIQEKHQAFGGILKDAGYLSRRGGQGNQYAIYGSSVTEGIISQTVVQRVKTAKEDNHVPYIMDGKEYINTKGGLSKISGVPSQQITAYVAAGLMTDCYTIGEKGILVFDVAKSMSRFKQMNLKMTDEQREALRQLRKDKAYKRGLFNQEMKRNNSRQRLYKSPEDEALMKLQNDILREERKLLKKEVEREERKLDRITGKIDKKK
ncbi:DNA primase family protein [Petrimonas sulfuriphila]|uniref:DNA primase family protein n=1 Tax=Petrimonas sulfuriphila TaxID=285070 RepID=UPI003EBA4FA0